MISIQLMGGLGNQMFQICVALACSIQYSMKLVIPYHSDMGYRRMYWDSFFKEMVEYTTENPENQMTDANVMNMPVYIEKQFKYCPIPDFKGGSIRLSGYFQSFKYFEAFQENILKILNIENKKKEVLTKYSELFDSSGETVSIHFRLGDYKALRHYHPIMNYEYFEASLDHIMRTNRVTRVIYICEEEDNAYVESKIQLLKSKHPVEYVKVEDSIPDYDQMLIMACCHHNIISNSSFSWWGAYLNDSASKVVCYPSVWFGEYFEHVFDYNDVTPSSWTKIEANPMHWRQPFV